MKRIIVSVVCLFSLFILSQALAKNLEWPANASVDAVLNVNSAPQQDAEDFLKTVMGKLKTNIKPDMDMATIEKEIMNYAVQEAGFLIQGGLKTDKVSALMHKFAGGYSDILIAMAKGKSEGSDIDDYLDKLRDTLSEANLSSIDLNSIIELTRENFGVMSNLLKARWN